MLDVLTYRVDVVLIPGHRAPL